MAQKFRVQKSITESKTKYHRSKTIFYLTEIKNKTKIWGLKSKEDKFVGNRNIFKPKNYYLMPLCKSFFLLIYFTKNKFSL